MPSQYPGNLDSLPTTRITGNVIPASDHNDTADAVNKIEAELGTLPKGSSATVKARLESLALKANLPINVKNAPYNAVGDGVADDTAAIQNALNAAGAFSKVFAPAGSYLVGDLALQNQQELEGVGPGTTFIAKTAAVRVLDINGRTSCKLTNLTIDGNARASVGVRITGSATAGSQRHYFERVNIRNCSTGLSVAQGTVTQADKNTYIACQIYECNIGAHINSVNAQEQFFIGGGIDSCTVAIRAERGSLAMRGTQFQSHGTGIDIRGPLEWINLEDVIFEAATGSIDIDAFAGGASGSQWPTEGIKLTNCVLQGLSHTIRGFGSGGTLDAEYCRFVNGVLLQDGTDSVFHEKHCRYTFGATHSRTGTTARHYKWDANGMALRGHSNVAVLDILSGLFKLGSDATAIRSLFPYSQAVDLPSVAANTTVDVNVPAASITVAVGDQAVFMGAPGLNHGLLVNAVPATLANNLRLRVSNLTGAAIDAASMTFYFLVVKL